MSEGIRSKVVRETKRNLDMRLLLIDLKDIFLTSHVTKKARNDIRHGKKKTT